jgi:hypothetical protein
MQSESNAFIKKEIANFDLENVGEDSFSKFRQFKLWSVENDVFEDTNVIKHLTKLAQASEEYTAKWSKFAISFLIKALLSDFVFFFLVL